MKLPEGTLNTERSFERAFLTRAGARKELSYMKTVAAFGFVMLSMSSLVAQEATEGKTYQLAEENARFPIGRQFLQKHRLSGKDAALTLRIGEHEIEGTMNNLTLEERVVAFPEEGKIRISVLKDQSKMAMTLGGNPVPPRDEVKPAVGKVFLLERKEGQWVGRVEKGEVLPGEKEEVKKEMEKMEKIFNEGEDAKLYGVVPRAVGERWDVDPKFMPGMGDMEVTGGKLSLHFKEVKDYQGELCAVVETTFDVKALSNEEDQKGMVMNLRGSGRILRSLALMTDYKFMGEALFVMEGDVPPPAPPNAQMKMNGEMTVETRMTEIKAGE